MKLEKRVFFDTEKSQMGHCSIFKKNNGNTYLVYFIEERYKAFQEFDISKKLINGQHDLGFSILNRDILDVNFNKLN